jgi:hypothetical protein
LERLKIGKVGTFCGHLEYIMAICYNSLAFGNLAANNIFSLFGILCQEKYGNPVLTINVAFLSKVYLHEKNFQW